MAVIRTQNKSVDPHKSRCESNNSTAVSSEISFLNRILDLENRDNPIRCTIIVLPMIHQMISVCCVGGAPALKRCLFEMQCLKVFFTSPLCCSHSM